MDDTIAYSLMTRIDIIKDKVDDISNSLDKQTTDHEQMDIRVANLETASITINDTLVQIDNTLSEMKTGPLYLIDTFIRRKVATYSLGMGTFGVGMWYLVKILLF
jgi:Mg2+ and Co2+ transporter CorA|tara:strand:+ start:4292 stop:4606 length:315 start_codon:yes stop_codon:yes gene_type:complete